MTEMKAPFTHCCFFCAQSYITGFGKLTPVGIHIFSGFFLTLSGKKSPTSELSLDAFEICLHSGKSSAIIEPSGMVNEFQECTARILIWQKPGLLGLFAVFIYSYRRKNNCICII